MKKTIFVLLILTMLAVLSAETTFSYKGVLRTRMAMYNYIGEDTPTYSYIDTRLRMSFIPSFSENLKAVWQLEIGDIDWGELQSGGGVNTDGINVETKHLYLDFVCPKSGFNASIGLLRFEDHNSFVLGADMGAIMLKKSIGPGAVQIGTAKLLENDYDADDDTDLFFLNYYHKNFGIENIVRRYNGGDYIDAWLMPYFIYTLDKVIFDIQAMYNYGHYKMDDRIARNEDVTNGGYAVDFKVKYKSALELGLEFVYVSGDDGEDPEKTTIFNTIAEYNFNGLEIFGRNIHDGQQIGWIGTNNGTLGTMNAILTGAYPFTDDMKIKVACGYLNTVEKVNDETNRGMEFDLGFNWDIYKPLAFDLVGAMAMPNEDYYGDSDSVFELCSRVQYKF
ncbi:MAG: hypothetical protein JXB60_07700 [Candidatus Cloacimonetes bacterium]|nr:hypothetical protein [Candidatus Cloacimonadota bacterium]